MRPIRSAWAAWAVLVLLTGTAWADGVMLNGVSPRAIGRGGTNLGFADNGALLYNNPAAAVNIEGTTLFDAGVDMILNDFHFSNVRNNQPADDNLMPLPQVSFIRRSDNGQVAWGLGVFTPAGFSEDYDLIGPVPFSTRQHYKSFGSLMKFLPGAAFRVNDQLSVGGTFGLAVSHDELEGPYCLNGPNPLAGIPILMDLQATGAAPCWSIALQYELTEETTFGFIYESESRFRAAGNTSVVLPGGLASRYDSELHITWPSSLGLGIRHELCPHRIISTDVIWYNWSAAFDDLGIKLTNPSTPGFFPLEEQLPMRWRDTVSVRLGFEQHLANQRVLRFGYVYNHDPIPDATLTPFIQAIGEHGFSAGYGWTWRSWEIDFAYMFVFGSERHVGVSALQGDDYTNSTHRAQTHDISFSFLRRF